MNKADPEIGDSITFTCVVEGNPLPEDPELSMTVQSSSDTSDIPMTCTTGTFTKTCTAPFDKAALSDSGEYNCTGKNTIDNVDKSSSDVLQLDVG